MSYRLTVLKPDGTRVETFHDKSPGLEVLQKAVGGYIETIPLFTKFEGRRCTVYGNEEGKLKRQPVNVAATELWRDQPQTKGRPLGDVLVGDIIIVEKWS